MTREELFQIHKDTCRKAFETMVVKNHDYASGSDPFANFKASSIMGVSPEIGILVRCIDKFQRIKSFSETGSLMVKNESVEDAIEDVINYMILLKGIILEGEEDA